MGSESIRVDMFRLQIFLLRKVTKSHYMIKEVAGVQEALEAQIQ